MGTKAWTQADWKSTGGIGKAQHDKLHRKAKHSTAQHGTAQHAMHSTSSDKPHACLPQTFVWLVFNLSADGVCASEDG